MRDIWEYLLLAGAVGIGIYSEIKKSKAKKSEHHPAMPTPATKPISTISNKKKEVKQESVADLKARKEREEKYKETLPEEGTRSTYSPIVIPKETQSVDANIGDNEFAISTPEEARRAIIWSEILQKKY